MKADTQSNSKLLAIQKLIITMLVIIFSIPITFSIQKPQIVQADLVSDLVNLAGADNQAGNTTIPNGVSYKRTGYLLYMVDAKSGDLKSDLKAFPSPGFQSIPGSKWVVKGRKGGTVDHFESVTAPWDCTPWTPSSGGGVISNQEELREWFGHYGRGFVQTYFSSNYDAFMNNEQLLAVEIIMNFQYAEKTGSGTVDNAELNAKAEGAINEKYDLRYDREKKNLVEDYARYVFSSTMMDMVNRWNTLAQSEKDNLVDQAKRSLILKVSAELASQSEGTYVNIGDPLIGTVPNLVDNRQSSVFDSYIYKAALHAMKISYSEAGFIAYPGSDNAYLSTSEVHNYGVAMMLLHKDEMALSAGQSTSDSSSSQPHQAPKESTGTTKIVKTYISSTAPTSNPNNKTYKHEGTYITTDVSNTITIEDETTTTGYKLLNWVVSDELNENINPISSNRVVWSSNIQGNRLAQGTGVSTVTIPESSVLYLLLEKDTNTQVEAYDFKVSQSHLTKRVRFSEATKTQPLLGVNFTWTSSQHNTVCGGHSYKCEGCRTRTVGEGEERHTESYCPGHTAFCSNGHMADTSVQFSLVNSLVGSNPDVLINSNNANFKSYIAKDTTSLHKHVESYTRPGSGADSWSKSGWDYVCVLYRGKDQVTIAEFKNTCNTLVNIGFPQGNTPSGSRKDADYMESFNAKIVDQPSTDKSTYYKFTDSGHGVCSNSRSYGCSTSWAVNNVKVLVEVYNGASISPTVPALKKNQVADDAITFYPYVRMQYDTVNSTQNVYVLGRYPRTLNTTSYALIRTDKDTKTNNHLELYSSQWSTHTTINENLSVALNNTDLQKIIPGGAIVSIQNKEATGKSIVLETYQCYLTGNGKTQVQKTGIVPSSMDGDTIPKQNHRDTVNSVIEGIKGINLQMYGQTSLTGSFQQIKPGSTFKQLTSTGGTEDRLLNTDSKYYWNNFSETYLDAVEKDTSEDRYTFSTDTNGNILMNGSVILSKGSSLSSLSGDAKKINAYTHVVDQLYTQLERDTGYDEESTWGATWYNEAFDGITVLVSKTRLNIGYFNPTERQSVIDPKLSVVQSGKNTMTEKLTSQSEAKKRFDAFYLKTSKQSSVYNIDNQIAEFRGTQLYTNENEYSPSDEIDLDEILSTDIFYTTTQTTQDLK